MVLSRKARKTRYAKRLRKRMTPEEDIMWEALRDRRLQGWKFRRQVPVGRFIVDFLCYEKSLIVELDGGIHRGQRAYDAERDQYLREKGYHVLHIPNGQVQKNLTYVLNAIARFKERS